MTDALQQVAHPAQILVIVHNVHVELISTASLDSVAPLVMFTFEAHKVACGQVGVQRQHRVTRAQQRQTNWANGRATEAAVVMAQSILDLGGVLAPGGVGI